MYKQALLAASCALVGLTGAPAVAAPQVEPAIQADEGKQRGHRRGRGHDRHHDRHRHYRGDGHGHDWRNPRAAYERGYREGRRDGLRVGARFDRRSHRHHRIDDYRAYGLRRPPPGHYYVEADGEILLIAAATLAISAILTSGY